MGDRFSELRQAHEQQLHRFLQSEVELAHTFVATAEAHRRSGNPDAAERSLSNAERGYATVLRFISDPKHHLGNDYRRELAARMQELRKALDRAAGR